MLLFPKLDPNTIFDIYDKDCFLSQLRELKYFCLLRGRLNAYVTDGDTLVVEIAYDDKEDLIKKFDLLDIPLRILSPDEPRLDLGKPYPVDEAEKLPTPTRRFRDIVQPLVQTIKGERVFVSIGDDRFEITPSEGLIKKEWWKVSEAEIESAKRIEIFLEQIGLAAFVYDEGQKQHGRYINRYHYPELFT